MNKNEELKRELHKSRKNNGILRSRVTKRDKEINQLRNDKLGLVDKIERLEKDKIKQSEFIKQQEKEIMSMQAYMQKPKNSAESTS